MTKRGKLNLILGIGVILVWGVVGFQLVSRYFGTDEEIVGDEIIKDTKNYSFSRVDEGKFKQFVYTSLERDPFRFGRRKPKVTKPSLAMEVKKESSQILFNLIGIVADRKANLAIIEEGNTTKFLRKGDRIGEFTIKKVDKDRIILNNGKAVLIK